jgi:hypothetical protein
LNITFDIPHYYSSDSIPEEKQAIADCVGECLSTFKKDSAKGIFVRKPSVERTAQTQITFFLPDAFRPDSTSLANAKALRTLLRCLSSIDLLYLKFRQGAVVPLYMHPVYYDRTIVWDSTPALYARGHGDCKTLACTQEAEYQYQGIPCETVFRFDPPTKDKPVMLYHILLQTPMGQTVFEDPSKVKGMGANENAPQYVM